MADQWYYSKQGQRVGPVSEAQLQQLVASGQLQPTDLVWKQGMTNWTSASNAGLFPCAAESAGPPPPTAETGHKFCRNCGKPVDEKAVACMSCGLAPTNGNKFCRNCGAETNPAAIVCVKCGVSLTQMASPTVQRTPQLYAINTVWPQLFESATTRPGHPGYWKVKPIYWILLVVGVVTIPFVVGLFILPFLGGAAAISRNAWRTSETVAAIRETK